MNKKIKIFISFLLCCVFVFLTTGCFDIGTGIAEEEFNPDTLYETGTVLYPKTNDYFRYNVYTNYVTISECLTDAINVEIPDKINELPVLKIENNAFAENGTIESIKMGKYIDIVDYNAFYNCKNLSQVILPEYLRTIGDSAFANCTSLQQISIPSKVTMIDNGAFSACSNLEKVVVVEGDDETAERTISSSSFADCISLRYVWIPNEVTVIDYNSFYNSLENLTVYGYSGSTAAVFCVENLINFYVLNMSEFNDVAVISNKIDIPEYRSVDEVISNDLWQIKLLKAEVCSRIGTVEAKEGCVFLLLTLNVTNVSLYGDQYFNYLDTQAVVSGYNKDMRYVGNATINGLNILSGTVAPQQTLNGYLLYEINENWLYAYVSFAGIDGFNTTSSYDYCLAAYPQ